MYVLAQNPFSLALRRFISYMYSYSVTGLAQVLENPEVQVEFYHAIFQDCPVLENCHWSWKVLEIC